MSETTTYVSAGDLLRHVASGHDVLLVHAASDPDDIAAVHCDEPDCEWNIGHFAVVPKAEEASTR